MGVLGAGPAQALIVTVNGQKWDVTTYTLTGAQLFASPSTHLAKICSQPWYSGGITTPGACTPVAEAGPNNVASAFATAVGISLGLPNVGNSRGPYFSYAFGFGNSGPGAGNCGAECYDFRSAFFDSFDDGVTAGNFSPTMFSFTSTRTFAQAYLVPPAPGPLPALGAAAAFGFSRKLRKRIKVSKVVGASATAV